MKTKLNKPKDIRELTHQWANNPDLSAKCGNVFCEDGTLYSYGRHFPVATLRTLDDGTAIVLFNPDRYSVSTSKHQSYARGAVSGREVHYIAPVNWGLCTTREGLARAIAIQAEDNAATAERDKEAKRQAAKERRERKELEAMDWQDLAAKWRAGDDVPRFALERGPVLLRLRDDGARIETSRGAIVPARVAPLAWGVIQKGQDDPAFDWGHYKGLTVTPSAVVIGCHNIPLEEIRLMAETLKIAA